MKIQHAKLYKVALPLIEPFRTSYGVLDTKTFLLLELTDELGTVGYGELDAFLVPDYTEETLDTAAHIIEFLLLPKLKKTLLKEPEDIRTLFSWVKGNEMAKAAIDSACYDLFAKRRGISLAELLRAKQKKIPVGVSIGIQNSEEELISSVRNYVAEGYTRVKIKIKPHADLSFLQKVREEFPDLLLMADANSAYTTEQIPLLKQIDQLNLAMIEQPFSVRDFVNHAQLQKQIHTPVCLDENIRSLEDTIQAYKLQSAKAINLKIARVGGLTEAIMIAKFCDQVGMLVWCGGMLEAGIGRAFNIALAARSEFHFPGDISATKRYFKHDIIKQDFELNNGEIEVPQGLGIGVEIDRENLQRFTIEEQDIVLD